MKTIVLALLVLAVAGSAWAGNVPSGVTGFWRFEDGSSQAASLKATIGVDLQTSSFTYNTFPATGPWVHIGTDTNHEAFTDNGCVQETANQCLIVKPSFTANGGGAYVNQYTVAIDYRETASVAYNSLFQTSWDGNANDGDLWMKRVGTDGYISTIGAGAIGGYSDLTFDASQFHRIVWSVNNGAADGTGGSFKVFVDGVLFFNKTDGSGTDIGMGMDDDTYALYPDRFNLFGDNDWENTWGYVETAATWDHALTTNEVAGMGSPDTPLIFSVPVPSAFVLLALGLIGAVAYLRRHR